MTQDPDAKICKQPCCTNNAGWRTEGYCNSHYEESKEDEADYLYNYRRDMRLEERERESND